MLTNCIKPTLLSLFALTMGECWGGTCPSEEQTENLKLVISELWVSPEEGPEWVELLYCGTHQFAASSLSLRRNGRLCSFETAPLHRGDRLVITSDTTAFRERFGKIRLSLLQSSCWHSLPNTGGTLSLINQWGELVDSVAWKAVPKERPLRRIYPSSSSTTPPQCGEMELQPLRSAPTPGYHRSSTVRADTVLVSHHPRQLGDPAIIQWSVSEGETVRWKLLNLYGKIEGLGEEKGPAAGRTALLLPHRQQTPLWLHWSILPSGSRGTLPILAPAP